MPSITTLSALAKVYNKSLSELFKEVDRQLNGFLIGLGPVFIVPDANIYVTQFTGK